MSDLNRTPTSIMDAHDMLLALMNKISPIVDKWPEIQASTPDKLGVWACVDTQIKAVAQTLVLQTCTLICIGAMGRGVTLASLRDSLVNKALECMVVQDADIGMGSMRTFMCTQRNTWVMVYEWVKSWDLLQVSYNRALNAALKTA